MFSDKAIEYPVEQLTPAVAALKSALGDNLLACVLYGSAVRGGLIPRISDLNLLIVVRHSTAEAHELVIENLGSQKVVDPIIVSGNQLKRLFELFPVRFRSIQRNYQVLAGEDPLQGHRPLQELVRFNCEQCLRRLELEAVHLYLVCRNDPRAYLEFLADIEVELFVVLSEMLRQQGHAVPTDFHDRIPLFVERLGVDETVLDGILLVKEGKLKLSRRQTSKFHRRFTIFLAKAIEWFGQQPAHH